jgi:anaerobic glycerol-3-phosphate dehydrogenase
MKRGVWIIKIFLVMLVCWTQTIAAQQATLNPQLINLKSAIDRTAAIVRLLPEFPDNEVKTEIEANLQKARLKYREAEEFAQNGQNQRAKLAIQQAYKLLQQIEFLIKQHPIFKIKFQELLERKI